MFFFVHAPGCCAPFFPPIHPSIHPPPPSPLTSSSPMAGFVTSLLPPLPSPFVFGPVRRFVLIILNPAPRASNFRPPRCSCLATTRREEGGRVGKGKKEGGKSVGKFERYSRRRKWRKQISPSLLIAICTRLSLLLPLLLPPPKVSRIGISSNAY